MAKKTTTKGTTTKKTSKSTSKRKPKINTTDNSTGLMLLVSVGLILLIYFGANVDVDTKMNVDITEPNTKVEAINEKITISGKTYSSRESARETLKLMPQSQLTSDEINFVESYKE